MFVIETGAIASPDYLTLKDGKVFWQGDVAEAMGFAREQDAEAYAAVHIRGIMAVDDLRITDV